MGWFRRAGLMEFNLLRLRRYSIFEALVCLLARRVCGTPVYWYPKREREALRAARLTESA